MSRVRRNIVYNGLGQGLSAAVGFVAVRFVFRRLGGDALGMIYFSLAVSAALTVAVQLGICESAVREVAAHHTDRPDYIKSFIRTSTFLYWTSFLVLSTAVFFASPYLVHHWVKLESLDGPTAIRLMHILAIGALAALPAGLYRALLIGLQHMGITNLIDVGTKALQQAGIFIILLMHGDIFHVAWWIAGSSALPVATYWLVCTRYFTVRTLLTPGFSVEVIRENFSYASGLMTITLCSWVMTQIDRVIISKLLPLVLLGIYTFARGAITQGMVLVWAINGAVFPHFSALYGSGKFAELRNTYDKIQELICFGTIPVFAAVPFAAIPLFSRVFDARSAHQLLLPSIFLCIGYYMNGTLTTPYAVSLAMGRPDITARQNAVALLIVPPVTILAIYWFGLNGAGFSWVIFNIYAYSYGLPRICRECIGIAPRAWYRHVLRIMGLGALIYGTVWGVLAWLGDFSVPALAAGYIVGTIVYGAAAFGMIGDSSRAAIVQYATRGRGLVQRVLVAP